MFLKGEIMLLLRMALIVLGSLMAGSNAYALAVTCGGNNIGDNVAGDLLPGLANQIGVRNCAIGGGLFTGTVADAAAILGRQDFGGVLFMGYFSGASGGMVNFATTQAAFLGGNYTVTPYFSGTLQGNGNSDGSEFFSLNGQADNLAVVNASWGPLAKGTGLPQPVKGSNTKVQNLPKGNVLVNAQVNFNDGVGTRFLFAPPGLAPAALITTDPCTDLICDITPFATQYPDYLGSVQVTAVPEPGTLSIASLGVLLLVARSRRYKRAWRG